MYKFSQYPMYPMYPDSYRSPTGEELYNEILNKLVKGALLSLGTGGTLAYLRQRELKKALYAAPEIARKAVARARVYNELLPILAIGSLLIPVVPTVVDILRSRDGSRPFLPGISPFPYVR